MAIQVINMYKDVSQDREDIYIGRGSPLGNPYVIGKDGTREEVIQRYAIWLDQQIKEGNTTVLKALDNILIKHRNRQLVRLVCFCKPKKCHGDFIKTLVENFDLGR